VSVQTDSAGQPSGTILASTTITPGNPVQIGYLPLVSFVNPASLIAGSLYHVVFRNVDPSPTANYVSLDGLWTFSTLSPRQARISDDFAHLINTGSGWTIRANMTPILALNYANGVTQGQGYMEIWVRSPKSISGSSKVRETFTPQSTVTASTLSLRVMRVSGSSPLTVSLGGLTATIPASSIAVSTPGVDQGGDTLVTVPFPVTLNAGTTYSLVWSAPADTVYSAYGVERGNHYNFQPTTYFPDGYGQYTTDGITWTGFDQPGGSSNNSNADLQFILR
jgi:hypothetical protein